MQITGRPAISVDESSHVGARHFCDLLSRRGLISNEARILVAGCGRGHEADFIQRHTGAFVAGVDVALDLLPEVRFHDRLDLQKADVTTLPFDDKSFNVVFYHHVIEHVTDPAASLRELGRVLVSGGWLYIGTPNRHRLLGYVGSYNTSLKSKIAWNLKDYADRTRGRFRNEFGAHAGFSRGELGKLLSKDFKYVEWLTADYLRFKYGHRVPRTIMDLVTTPLIQELSAPSLYAVCRR